MNYALIKNGIVQNVIVADEEFISSISDQYDHIEALDTPEEQKVAGPGWLYDSIAGEFTSPPEPEEIKTWKITKLAFKNRFPRAKWIAAKFASQSDPIMADFFETFELSTFIDLQSASAINDVTSLSQEGVPESFRLTQEEVDDVLNVPAQPHELP